MARSAWRKARVAAETALRLAPNLSESHLAKAQYYYNGLRDYEKAQAELAAAPPPSPGGRARFFDLTALTERRLGHWKEALRDGEKAWELDPHDPFIATEVIQTYMFLRRYPEAEKKAEQAIRNISTRAAPFFVAQGREHSRPGRTAARRGISASVRGRGRATHLDSGAKRFYQRDFAKARREIELARKWPMAAPTAYLDLMEGTIARAARETRQEAGRRLKRLAQTLEASLQNRPQDAPDIDQSGLGLRRVGPKGRRIARPASRPCNWSPAGATRPRGLITRTCRPRFWPGWAQGRRD